MSKEKQQTSKEADYPVVTSIGMHKSGEKWIPFVMRTRGTTVIAVESGEVSDWPYALDSLRVMFVEQFADESKP